MDISTSKMLLAASGAGGGASDPLYVDDVFSIDLHTGTSASKTITNGIDLAGEGGLVWNKGRSSNADNWLYDTERGVLSGIRSNTTDTPITSSDYFEAFNSDGFRLGSNGSLNYTGSTYVAWSFRKAPGFFDIVTFTGDSNSEQQISHSLGSTPGMVIVKRTDFPGNWPIWHVKGDFNPSEHRHGFLNNTSDLNNYGSFNNAVNQSTYFTDSYFTVRSDTNTNGGTYVAYVFANDDAQFGAGGNESIIKCGSFSSTGLVDLGWEPQWVIMKSVSDQNAYTGDWRIFDDRRGIKAGDDAQLFASDNRAEDLNTFGSAIKLDPRGFVVEGQGNYGTSTVFMAIRRPHKPATTGSEVLGIATYTGDGQGDTFIPTQGVTPDLFASKITSHNQAGLMLTDRLRGGDSLVIASDQGDANSYWTIGSWKDFDVQGGIKVGGTSYSYNNDNGKSFVGYSFKRTPGFFDMVLYDGGVSGSNVYGAGSFKYHNLGVVPELIFFKTTGSTIDWHVKATSILGRSDLCFNQEDAAPFTNNTYFDDIADTATKFYSRAGNGAVNGAGYEHIAYLFASLDGVSKVGSYSGNGIYQVIDCGFTSGARFVLIKRTDADGDWFIWDTARGITSSGDQFFASNLTNAAVQDSQDYLYPDNTGFGVRNSSGGSNNPDINLSGATYLFLAIS